MKRQPTPQQEAIYEAIRTGQGHLVVEALAGTGKSTTAIGCLNQGLTGRIGFVAFNSHIAKELQERLPPTVPACTLHSLGFAAVRKRFRDVQVDEQKLTRLAKSLQPDVYPSVRQAAEQLTRLCKYTLTNDLPALVEHHGVEIDDRDRQKVFKLTSDLFDRSAAETSTIDYDDMVWFPVHHGIHPDQFDLLLVDEAQDLNRCQQSLARAATASGRLGPIGDRNQAIYGFSGADVDALPRLGAELAATVLPLTVTWRCPTSHVELARQIVPTLEAAPNAFEGKVYCTNRAEIATQVRPGDLVICSKNAPVVGLTYRLVLAGVPAVMRGREIGKGLLTLIARLNPDSISHLIDRIEDYRDREDRRLRRQDAPASSFDALEDRCDCLSQLATQATSLEDLEAFIRKIFDDHAQTGQQVVLSSVHRAKGLEADNVFVLDPDSLPLIRRDSKPWQRQQESNLVYIAATRAKRVLTFEDRIPSIFGDRTCDLTGTTSR